MKFSLARRWLTALAVLGITAPALAQGRTVNVYGWGDYIDPKVLSDFTKETGIMVSYESYDSAEKADARIMKGQTGFDAVIVPGDVLRKHLSSGLYQTLDRSRLANSKYLWPEIMARLAAYDPGNQHAVNYQWFTAGIAYNVEKAKELLGEAAVEQARERAGILGSWDVVFKPQNLKKFAGCGVTLPGSGEEMFAIALIYLKGDPGSVRPADIKRAGELLYGLRRNVEKFDSREYASGLADGDICLAAGYSMASLQARDRAREADNGVEIGYVIPAEGSLMVLDNLAIPADAPHAAEAYAFIDFLLRPEIAARNTNFTHIASGVILPEAALDREISSNPSIYPEPAVMQKLFAAPVYEPALQRAILREWERIKTGK
jgi:putrescine transport system substrate-binding protein